MIINPLPIAEKIRKFRQERQNLAEYIPFSSVYKLKEDNREYSSIYEKYHEEGYLTAMQTPRFPKDFVYVLSAHLGWVYHVLDYVDVVDFNADARVEEIWTNNPQGTNYFSLHTTSVTTVKNVPSLPVNSANNSNFSYVAYDGFRISEEDFERISDEDLARHIAARFTNQLHFGVIDAIGRVSTSFTPSFTGASAPVNMHDYIRAGTFVLSLLRTDETKHYVCVMPNALYYRYITTKQRSRDEVYEFEKFVKVMPVGLNESVGFSMQYYNNPNWILFFMNDSHKIVMQDLTFMIRHNIANNTITFILESHFHHGTTHKNLNNLPSITSAGSHTRSFYIDVNSYTP